MTLLEDIQSAAVDQNSDLGTILRKCKLLAARLDSKALENWITYESNGYPKNIEVPSYRMWPLEVKGNFSGPYGSELRNVSIPLNFLPENARDSYRNYQCRQSIASLVAIVDKDKNSDDGIIQVEAAGLAIILGRNVYKYQNCIAAWGEIGIGHIIDLLNAVRNRILDFALAVSKQYPEAGELNKMADHNISQSTITQIFYTTVHGGSANLVGTTTDSSIAFNIVTNDFPSLARALTDKGILTEDITELEAAVDSDPRPITESALGPKVSQWIAKMVQKAADGSWNIGVGAAGGLLAQAIAKYYGL